MLRREKRGKSEGPFMQNLVPQQTPNLFCTLCCFVLAGFRFGRKIARERAGSQLLRRVPENVAPPMPESPVSRSWRALEIAGIGD
eukprot:scaffold5143_cov231-Pinguiococcus_pyrenoidosus.AAC.6